MSATKTNTTDKAEAHGTRNPARGISACPSTIEAADWRVAAGNLALQHLLCNRAIQAKLHVSSPDDPYEQEADNIARLMVSPAPGSLVQRSCAACSAGAQCPKCEEEQTIQRKASQSESRLPARGIESPRSLLRGSGRPLPPSVRAYFEPRFGKDLSGLRIHTDDSAAESARALGAKAFTMGRDIVFGEGQFAPESSEGRELLAHEMVHTLQQGVDDGPVVRRYSLDPTNTSAWDWYGSESHRDSSFLETVGKAQGTAGALVKQLGTTEAPKTDEEREALEKQILTLIRLNAVSMVGAHRAQLAERKRQFQQMAVKPPEEKQKEAEGSPSDPAADTAKAIRGAAQTAIELNADKERLGGLRDDSAAAVKVNDGPETIAEEFRKLSTNAQQYTTSAILASVEATRNSLRSGDLAWGSKKFVLLNLGAEVHALREKQINGINLSLTVLYDGFPFLADLEASYITTGKKHSKTTAAVLGAGSVLLPILAPLAAYVGIDAFKADKPLDDQTLLAEVQASFDRLLLRTDEAIVKVGSGSINPLDLPGAVAAARGGLPAALQKELDRMKQDHEVFKFATDMALALGIAVLSGVTAGAAGVGLAALAAAGGVATAGLGVAQLGMQAKDLMDRRALAAASTSPDGQLLGVSAPSMFEWAMLAVSAALTAADLAALAKQIGALRPAFSQEPHPSFGKGEPGPPRAEGEPGAPRTEGEPGAPRTEGEPGAPRPEGEGASSGAPKREGTAGATSPAEQKMLEAGRGDAPPSRAQIDAEMAVVRRTEPRKLSGGQYIEEVELTNGHTWRRDSKGNWCRFSNGKTCVPGTTDAAGTPGTPQAPLASAEALAKANQELETVRSRYGPELDANPDLKAEATRIEGIGDPAVKSADTAALREKLSDARASRIEGPRTATGAIDVDAWGARLKAEGVKGDIDDIVRRAKRTDRDAIAARGELRAIERARLRGYEVEMLTPPKGPGAAQGVKTPEGKIVSGGKEGRMEVKTATEPPDRATWNAHADKANKQIKASGKSGEISFDWTETNLAGSTDFKSAGDIERFLNGKMTNERLTEVRHFEIVWKDPAGQTWVTSRTRSAEGIVGPVVTERI